MFAVERLSSYISKGVYTVSGPFHIFGGAVDIIVVQHPDGSFKSAPWYVKFGKFQGVLKSKEKVVSISVNGSEAGFHMYLDHKGEAYFLKEEAEGDEDDIIFSPPSSGEEMEERSQNGRSSEEIPPVSFSSPINIPADQRCGFDGNFILEDANLDKTPQIDTANGKIMARTTSRRSRIFGLVFGRKSMKEDVKNRQGDANVQRISSLERAEIAADLLEMKWSTNLQTDNVKAAANHPRGTDGASRLSASGIPSEDVERELPVNNVEGRSSLLSSSSSSSSSPLTPAISDSVLNVSITSRDEVRVKTDDNLGTVSLEPKYSDEVSPRSDDLFQKKQFSAHCEDNMETHEQISAKSDSRISELMGSLGRLSESSMPEYCDVCTLQNTYSEETAIPSLSETSLNLQSPDTAGVKVSLISHSSICTDDNRLVEDSIFTEEIGRNSCIYCKASEFLTVEIDFVHEQDHKRDLSDKSCKELELHGESSSIPIEHVGDPNSCHGSCVHKGKGILYQCPCSDIGLSIDENCHKSGNVDADCGNDQDLDRCDCSELRLSIYENSCKFDAANADCREEETSVVLISNTSNVDALAMDGGDTVAKSVHSLDIRSDSIKAEAVEIFHSKRVALNDILDKNLEAEPVEFSQHIEENISFSSSTSCHLSDNERVGEGSGAHVLTEEIFKAPNSHARLVEKILVKSNRSNTNHQGQEFENVGYEVEMPERGLSSEEAIVNPQGSESVQEDQFLFSDSDIFISNCVSRELSFSTDVEEEKYLLLTCEDVEEQCEPLCVSQPLASDSSKPGEVGIRSTPINVPQINMQSRKVKRLPESLPNIRSHIHDLDSADIVLHTLSSSLNEDWKWGGTPKEFSTSPKMETTIVASSEVNSIPPGQPPPTGEIFDEEVLVKSSPSEVEIENILANPAVEISLCKHLLFEGMGADAASQVFDSEKVSLEKFITVGPSIVKNNDRLVVKIDGCYFPWDAAAPILLGMASFGLEKILKPQGMIAVNPVKKNLDKYPSPAAAIVPSWNLWPFSFKRSKSLINSVHSPGGDFNGTNIVSENICLITPDNRMHRRKPLKKKVRSLIPTSDQLASLKLREGQNVITFSFSTAMLGRQQVDARIYLWKWNTRIVISDVDGTITKSDVLGQFMPLVGKDWSQSGVAHLFSAIKENGYQLLFLSARAISQAYLTRQFLLNLKQDGKALPDGPVVISPDGLFPSLFREVIRRAPHEFKISCLEDIKALFPADCNPFYAGFGNRDTDEISYRKVGIPKGKIFIINPKGEVAVNRRVNTKSYTCLHSLVNGMFPAMCSGEQEDFNSWNYWKIPLPDIDI